jgi:hypothetical protein
MQYNCQTESYSTWTICGHLKFVNIIVELIHNRSGLHTSFHTEKLYFVKMTSIYNVD